MVKKMFIQIRLCTLKYACKGHVVHYANMKFSFKDFFSKFDQIRWKHIYCRNP